MLRDKLPKNTAGKLLLSIGLATLVLVVATTGAPYYFDERIYPGIYINSVSVGGKTKNEVIGELNVKVDPPDDLVFSAITETGPQKFQVPTSALGLSYDHGTTVNAAFSIGRNGSLIDKATEAISAIFYGKNVELNYTISEEKLDTHLGTIISQLVMDPVYPTASIVNGTVVINPGKPGSEINIDKVKASLRSKLAKADFDETEMEVTRIDPTLSETEIENFRQRAEKLIGKSLELSKEERKITYNDSSLVSFLGPGASFNNSAIGTEVIKVSEEINRTAQNPTFAFNEGKVEEFAPAKLGLQVREEELENMIKNNLTELVNNDTNKLYLEIPTDTTEPEVSTAEVNNLGIKELIGRGTSTYRGSIPSRVYNIDLAASRINGTLVKPGETLSFNASVGDVSKLSGYKEAYVIQNGRTVLGDGGGVCQVSTTLFRAALDSGLPISERRSHSYRVSYYEQDAGPGLDATVYAPTTDLKIVNDTPAHILVQAYADTTNYTLTIEFYGTSDGRSATITKPVITSSSPPPEDLYIDDPTLPAGTIKQVEHKVWGARTQFDYTVERDGEIIYEKTFYSVYRPWQAVFMRGTAPVQ